jgi:hypothetical protein
MKKFYNQPMTKFAVGLLMSMSAALAADAPWKNLDFLLGKWTATGSGSPGAGQGEYSFERAMNDHIVIRRNLAEYTSGQHHDDLMIIYADAPQGPSHAIYFDSEGHTIHYNVATPAPNSVSFESEPSRPGPRFRLRYVLEGKSLNGKFEIMEPGKTEYKTYLTWTSAKKP